VARPRASIPSPEEPGERPRFRHRSGRRIDEEDDLREPHESKGSGKLLWVILGIVALLSVAGIAGAGYVIYHYYDGRSGTDAVSNTTSPVGWPTKPAEPAPAPPTWERGRSPLLQAQGFQVIVPIGASGGPRRVTVDGENLIGARYSVAEGGIDYRVEWYDLPAELTLTAGAFARKVRELEPPATVINGPATMTLGGRTAEELIVRSQPNTRETIRAVRVGPRVIIFTAAVDSARMGAFPGINPDERLKSSFESAARTWARS
jgi:hypothetical protein